MGASTSPKRQKQYDISGPATRTNQATMAIPGNSLEEIVKLPIFCVTWRIPPGIQRMSHLSRVVWTISIPPQRQFQVLEPVEMSICITRLIFNVCGMLYQTPTWRTGKF